VFKFKNREANGKAFEWLYFHGGRFGDGDYGFAIGICRTDTCAAARTSERTVTYTVGDVMGWTMPASGAAAYRAWASSNTFEVGDILGRPRNDILV